ncbi:MAG: PEP-CTERM sorting domain-containing protein [Chthoniobacterales bacterium]|nr:PEP-CTERM sorting domain-containing protein [Chthoniobacterales bacterium]
MKKTLLPLSALLFSVLPIIPANAAVLWSENFQGMTSGSTPPVQAPPASVGINNITANITGTNRTIVTDAGTSPVDPFGGAGNKSLMFEKTGTGSSSSPYFFATVPETTLGILTFDLYTVNDGGSFTTPIFTFYTYDGGNWSNIGAFVNIFATSITAFSGTTAKTASSVITANTANQVSLEFFANSTYTVKVNGSAVSFSGTTVLSYYSGSASSIDRVRMGSQDTSNTKSRVFVDNIVLVPEPGTCILLGLAGMAFLLNRRKRRGAD